MYELSVCKINLQIENNFTFKINTWIHILVFNSCVICLKKLRMIGNCQIWPPFGSCWIILVKLASLLWCFYSCSIYWKLVNENVIILIDNYNKNVETDTVELLTKFLAIFSKNNFQQNLYICCFFNEC